MASINRSIQKKTFEGAPAKSISPEQELRRLVMSCLLWEKNFYESGDSVADRISELVPAVEPKRVSEIAVEARSTHHLRHVPLLLVRELCRHHAGDSLVSDTLYKIIQRPDEMTEFLALYWMGGRVPLSAQIKKGLAKAFTKFNAYQLAKYNRRGQVTLGDVMSLVHPRPSSEEQEKTWRLLSSGHLPAPDTWESALARGESKAATFERLIRERKLGAMAYLRNLRGMLEAGVNKQLIKGGLAELNTARILPWRFLAAAKHAPSLRPELETLFLRSARQIKPLTGRTAVLVDVSGSMECQLSARSDLTRMDAAAGLAAIVREMVEQTSVYTFSNQVLPVKDTTGFQLVRDIKMSQHHGGTYLGQAVTTVFKEGEWDRIVIMTDEQSHDPVPDPPPGMRAYMINVATNERGVGYYAWTHIDGFSEGVIRYIAAIEEEYEQTLSQEEKNV